MSTATSIATQSSAKASVTKAVIVSTNNIEYNLETYQKFSRSIFNVARAVPFTAGGGNHGHIYLLESTAVYTTHTGGTSYTKAVHPGFIDFSGATTNTQIVRVKETRVTDLETYNTQKGVRAGLRKITIVSVPTKILVELEDAESGLDKVKPRRLLETIKGCAAPVVCRDAMALKNARDAPLTFNTSKPLTTQFAMIKKKIGDLQRIHDIVTSDSEMMMMWLLAIEKQKDFEDHVEECRARTTTNGFNDFISFFGERDVEVCRLNNWCRVAPRLQDTTAPPTFRRSTSTYIDDKVNAEMANFAAAFEAALNGGALDSGATASFVVSNKTAANVVDMLTSNNNNHDAILATLKTISDCLEKVEKGGGRRRRRGRGGADKDANPQVASEERKPCVNYDKCHKVPDEKRWALDANKDGHPKNYVKSPPGLNKGNRRG